MDETQVIKIDPDGKYVLIVPDKHWDRVRELTAGVEAWWYDEDARFFFLNDNIKLEKVEG